MRIWETAGEATAWLSTPRRESSPRERSERRERRSAEELERDSARRAKGECRRYTVHNRMTHVGTLGNRDQVLSWSEISRRIERFKERKAAAGWHIPMLIVPEPHPGGHGYHAHFVAPRFIDLDRLRAWWPYGEPRIYGPKRRRRTAEDYRRSAGYISKYVGKGIGEEELYGCEPRPKGAHRYFVTEGFDPPSRTYRFPSLAQLERFVARRFGQAARWVPFEARDAYCLEGWWLEVPLHAPRAPPKLSLVG